MKKDTITEKEIRGLSETGKLTLIQNLHKTLKNLEQDFKNNQHFINKLNALESAGVDNWSGYSYAMDLLEEYKTEN